MPLLKKKPTRAGTKAKSKKRSAPAKEPKLSNDEELLSDDPDVDGRNMEASPNGYSSDQDMEDPGETAEEKRLRLINVYLEEIGQLERERVENEENLHDAVNQRLQIDNLQESGRLKQEVAHRYRLSNSEKNITLRDHKCHKEPLNCVAVSPCGNFFFTGSADAGLVKWQIGRSGGGTIQVQKSGRIVGGKRKQSESFEGHCHPINAIAISSDGKFLAVGDASKNIRIWDPKSLKLVHTFKGHRDSVTGLAFRKKTHTLFSASSDRLVKIWNLDEMAYEETLYGHKGTITGIDVGVRERCITSGGQDGQVLVSKVVDGKSLVFNSPHSSTDGIRLINEENFITYGQDGNISLWGTMKKRPLCTLKSAHGKDPMNDCARWITALAVLPMTDLLATGSSDGYIRFWRCSNSFRKLEPLPELATPVTGFVNGLAFSTDGKALIVCVGQTYRLGNWWRIKEARNSIMVVPLNVLSEQEIADQMEM